MKTDKEFEPLEAQRLIEELVCYLDETNRPIATWSGWVVYMIELMQGRLAPDWSPVFLKEIECLIASRREAESTGLM